MPSVLQHWVMQMPIMMQSTLLLGLRGCDTPYMPETKKIIKWLRGLTFIPGNPDNVKEFMGSLDNVPPIYEKGSVNRELDVAPHHFYSHLLHSLQVVAYMHPNEDVSNAAYCRFKALCDLMHLPIEEKSDFFLRLKDRKWPGGVQPMDYEEAVSLLSI